MASERTRKWPRKTRDFAMFLTMPISDILSFSKQPSMYHIKLRRAVVLADRLNVSLQDLRKMSGEEVLKLADLRMTELGFPNKVELQRWKGLELDLQRTLCKETIEKLQNMLQSLEQTQPVGNEWFNEMESYGSLNEQITI